MGATVRGRAVPRGGGHMGPASGASVDASGAGEGEGSDEHAVESARKAMHQRMARDRATELAPAVTPVVRAAAMARVHLIHWNADEAEERAERLRAAGHVVSTAQPNGSTKHIREGDPEALVIDLGRMPSHGASIAALVRQSKWGRHLPLVFVDGAPEKVARARAMLPDATYTTWPRIRSALRAAIANPLARPHVPKSAVAPSSVPLAKKLAIKPGATVVALDAPGSFEDALGEMPEGSRIRERGVGDLVIWFVRTGEDLERDVARVIASAGEAPVWIAWPKRSSGAAADLTSLTVIEVGRAVGRVDSKVCSIDETWSAIMFCEPSAKKRAAKRD